MREHPWVLGQATGILTHLTHNGPDSGEATTCPHIVFILCSSPRELHPNGTFSQDSQGGVPKLSRIGLPGLWTLTTPGSNLRLGWGLNQSCSFPQELSNAPSHSICTRREDVDSRLLVIGSQTANLTPGPSFAHNLGCKCPNGSCEAILDIYNSRPFHWYKEHPNARYFDPCCRTLKVWESRRTPSPQLWECEFHPHTWPKWGCDMHGLVAEKAKLGRPLTFEGGLWH
jgi:hypothetical protein